MPPSSLTLNYDAILSTTMFNLSQAKVLEDEISTSNAFLFWLMRQSKGAYSGVSSLGDRMQVNLMYQMGTADVYSGYDQLDVTPMDGITAAFFDWRQMAVPITISGIEEAKNSGEEQIVDLLKAKTKQALLGIQDLFGKALLQGNGPNSATAITTAYTSTGNGAVFLDPLPLLVKYDPTSSTSIGNINQATYTWWANKTKNSTSSTYSGFRKELRNLFNTCSRGPGGKPDIHLTDQSSFELYVAALEAMHQNPSYTKAELPFESVNGPGGAPVMYDEFVPDVQGGSTTQSTSSGTWWMLNTKFFSLKYHKSTNFKTTPFQKPENRLVLQEVADQSIETLALAA